MVLWYTEDVEVKPHLFMVDGDEFERRGITPGPREKRDDEYHEYKNEEVEG